MRRKILFSGFLFLGLFSLSVACSAPAQAQLTEDAISEFIKITTDISSGHANGMDQRDITEYLEDHLHEDARFKSTIEYNIPGFPPQKTSMTLKKKEYIGGIEKGAEALSDYQNEITIQTIKISKDGSRATVRTTGSETGTMPVALNAEDGIEYVPIEGASDCNQIIKLEDDRIQMYSAICSTKVNFQPFE